MGWKDWFSKDGKESRAVARWGNRLMAKWSQTAERKRAIEALTEIGTDEAIVALLRRYEFRTEATITDEEEKEMVFQCVLQLGEDAIPGLQKYISTQTAIYWPVKALRRIAGDEAAAAHLLTAFDNIPDSFGENQERRQQLVANMREFVDEPRIKARLHELLEDEDEDVVIRAIDGLSARGGDREIVGAIVPIILADETSIRVRTLVMELMIEQEWNVKVFRKKLAEKIPDSYFIDSTGVVRRR